MPDDKVDTAADLEAAKQQLADAETAHAAATAEAAANRTPDELVRVLFESIIMRLGNRPDMRATFEALKAKTSKYRR